MGREYECNGCVLYSSDLENWNGSLGSFTSWIITVRQDFIHMAAASSSQSPIRKLSKPIRSDIQLQYS